MTDAKERTHRRYTGGKTLNIPCGNRDELISIADCRTLLMIATRDTINDYLKTLGLYGRDFITWEEFARVLELQVFLGLKPGQNSKEMYRFLEELGHLPHIFQEFGIDVETRFRRLQVDYHKRQT